MSSYVITYLLTFVLTPLSVQAAPFSDPDNYKEKTVETIAEPPDFERYNMVPAKLPKLKKRAHQNLSRLGGEDYYFPYTSALAVRMGLWTDLAETSSGSDLEFAIGFDYTIESYYSPHWEVGVDLTSDDFGLISFGSKHTWNEKGIYRPFYKLGVTHKLNPDDRLASLTNYKNYMALAALGFENSLRGVVSLRLDLELTVGVRDVLIFFYTGISWGR